MRYILILIIISQIQTICQTTSPKREFRGIWIASVENIDWPSKKSLSSEQQKKEFITIIDRLKKDKINAVFIQVRPSCDALYPSEKEPWSEWLTGKQGKEPQPFYDPLKFVVEECHKRGIELHAWFNPFRSVVNIKTSDISGQHISRTHPNWNILYGKYKWLNPGIPEVRNYVTGIVMDVVKRYDIDGVHFDDYFYPYPIKNKKIHDEKTFEKYSRGINNLDVWRRDNINLFVKQVSDSIHDLKPDCIFGISPFGIWKNKSSDISGSGTNGSESYFKTYSDSKKWIKEGWVDYLVPQIYWHIGYHSANYNTLAEWWNLNSFGKNIYIGQAVYKVVYDYNEQWQKGYQIPEQIKLNRSMKSILGNVFFNTNTFLKNPLGLEDSLQRNYYHNYAIPPEINRNENTIPLAPVNGTYNFVDGKIIIRWEKQKSTKKDAARYFVIYRFSPNETVNTSKSENIVDVVYGSETSWMDRPSSSSDFQYVVTSLNSFKRESNDNCRIMIPSGISDQHENVHYIYSNPDTVEVFRSDSIATIIIKVNKLSLVTLKIYDFYGKEIKQLLHEYRSEGQYEFEFNEKEVNSKGYIVQMKTKGYYSTRKIYIE